LIIVANLAENVSRVVNPEQARKLFVVVLLRAFFAKKALLQ
jgi:hypothetical protein